jgi:hypothetical protein
MIQQEELQPSQCVTLRYSNELKKEVNVKYIDLVIYYKEVPEGELDFNEIKQIRKKFFFKIQLEGFTINYFSTHNKNKYVLLTCSLDRLMDEAEKLELELPLKIVIIFIHILILYNCFIR